MTEALKPYLEPKETEDQNAPVRCCLRYLDNRPGQFDYPGAQARDLPIGSGEIESAHRYIIQERLKIAGACGHRKTPERCLHCELIVRTDTGTGIGTV